MYCLFATSNNFLHMQLRYIDSQQKLHLKLAYDVTTLIRGPKSFKIAE